MKNNDTNPDNQPNQTPKHDKRKAKKPAPKSSPAKTSAPDQRTDEANYQKLPPGLRPFAGVGQRDPLHYDSHPYPSMLRFASLHTLQALLGHCDINTTMVYLHVTHRSEQDSRTLVETLCQELPR